MICRFFLLLAFLFSCLLILAGEPEEAICLLVEPTSLHTELARPLGGAKKTFVVPAREDKDLGLVRLSAEEFAATGLTRTLFDLKAQGAATRLLKTLKPEMQRDEKGVIKYATLHSDRHFTSSLLLSPEFPAMFNETFGDKLIVVMPDRFTLYVFPRTFSGFASIGPQVIDEFQKAVWPSSVEAFEVTGEGVTCLGEFDDGEGDSNGKVERTSKKPPLRRAETPAVPSDKIPVGPKKDKSAPAKKPQTSLFNLKNQKFPSRVDSLSFGGK